MTDLKIGLGGDVMIGRLVNRHLDHAPAASIWGNLLPILQSLDCNLINLEAALTRSEQSVPKVFNFKADPAKVAVLREGHIHIVNIANNHILDFSTEGLLETLDVLNQAGIGHVGAGRNLQEAQAPWIVERGGIKIGVLGCTDNEPTWKASANRPGTYFVEVGDIKAAAQQIVTLRQQVDLLIFSIHWGPNMRQRPTHDFRAFAYALMDLGVDILHGHSAHIFQGVEIYQGKLILYDTGDLVDDYAIDPLLRNDTSFFFIVTTKGNKLYSLDMIPTRISHFQVNRSHDEETLHRMELLCHEFHTHPKRSDERLTLRIV